MIIVTGGAGFIGANLTLALGRRAHAEVVVVDDLTHGHKFSNLVDCEVADYWDKQAFLERVVSDRPPPRECRAVFHQGACSDTTEWDGKYVMENNFEYSKQLFHYCVRHRIPFVYASSASVYGAGRVFRESREFDEQLMKLAQEFSLKNFLWIILMWKK